MQKERDRRAGLNTAGYVTGYRGSPLGGARPAVPARCSAFSRSNDIKFQPATQRRPRRDRALGLAAGGVARRRQVRWRVRHLVRQGPGRRPIGRRVPPCQFRRHLEARRRARADGRRPHRGILDHRAPVRIPFRRRDDPDPEPGRAFRRSSTTASTAGRCRASPAPGPRSNACTRRWNRPAVVDGSLDRVQIDHA